MKNPVKILSRTLAIAAVTGLLLSSAMMAGEAMAQGFGQSCGGTNLDQCTSPLNCTDPGHPDGVCAPEMSDYLAMAFIAVAGGMIYRFRRRALGVV